MKLLKKKTDFHFMGPRRIAYAISLLLMALSVVILVTRGLNFGLDFTGGTLIEVSFPGDADTDLVRNNLRGAGLLYCQGRYAQGVGLDGIESGPT